MFKQPVSMLLPCNNRFDVSLPIAFSHYFPLRERLRTHKVFTNYQCFYLNYHKFSIKPYVLDVYKNRYGDSNTHSQHMILWRNIENNPFLLYFDSDPRFPSFLLYVRWKSGSLLNGDVSVMQGCNVFSFSGQCVKI